MKDEQQILADVRPGWHVIGRRPATQPVTATDSLGNHTTTEQPIPGQFVWIIAGPNGQTDEITVKASDTTPPPAGTTDADAAYAAAHPSGYSLIEGPKKALVKADSSTQGVTPSNDPKGTRNTKLIDMPDGSKASIDVVADGLGNWNPDTSKPPVPYIAAADKPPPQPVVNTTLSKIPDLKNGVWSWVDNPIFDPKTGPQRKTQVLGTGPNDKFTVVLDTETGEIVSKTPNSNYQEPGSQLTPGQKATDTATAGIAPDVASATLTKAQADANTAKLQYDDAKRRYDSTTDEQVKQAVAIELQQKQTTLDAANQQLEQARKLMPLAVGQAQANLEQTQQNTQKGVLGTLYGLQDRAKQIADMIRSGEITDPARANALLQDYLTTTVQGTTPFERDRFATEQDTQRRQQDTSLAATRTSAFASGYTSTINNILNAAQNVRPGQHIAGAAMDEALRNFQTGLASNSALPASNYALANSLRPAVTPPAAPGATDGSGHAITINIGGSGAAGNPQPPAFLQSATAPLLPPGAAGTAADPNIGTANPASPVPAMLTANQPVTPDAHEAYAALNLHDLDPNRIPALTGRTV